MANPIALSELVSNEDLDKHLKRVTDNALDVDAMVIQVVDNYCRDIDWLMESTLKVLHDGLEDREVEKLIVQFPLEMYNACSAAEELGVRDDLSRMLYKEALNLARKDAKGTVKDKDSQAQLQTNAEALVAVVYNRAARTVKLKLDNAQEMLQALKKVLSHRMTEKELARADRGV